MTGIGIGKLPLFMHFAHTRIFLTFPATSTFFDWRFGKNRRLVIPVVLRPIPPFFLGKPLLAIELPVSAFFPQNSHLLLIMETNILIF